MKAAFVQSISAVGNSTAPSATYNAAPTQGNLLVAGVHSSNGTGAITMTSSGWTACTSTIATNVSIRFFYKIAGASESSTVTAASTSGAWDIHIIEYSGTDTVTPLNVENSKTDGSVTTVATPSVTPYANSGCLIVCLGGGFTAGATFSNYQIGGSTVGVTVREHTSVTLDGALYDKFIGQPSGSYTGQLTTNTGTNTCGAIAIFNLLVNSTNNYAFVSVGDGLSVSEKIQ